LQTSGFLFASNIEMLFLPHEMFRQKKNIHLFQKGSQALTFKIAAEWADWVSPDLRLESVPVNPE
jgi:hypothetical protein